MMAILGACLLVVGRIEASDPGAVRSDEGDRAALPRLGDAPSLQDYLRYAALENAGLEAAFNLWQAELLRVPQARSFPDPRLAYTYYIEEVETRVGPQRQKLALVQTFPWFGKRGFRGDAAVESAGAARQAYESAKLRLFYRVKSAYHDYWYLATAIEVTREHIRLVSNMEGVARARFKAGKAQHSDVIQAQVELGKLTDRLSTQEALRRPVVAGLNAALNRETGGDLPAPRTLPDMSPAFSDEQALRWLSERNPELARLSHLVAKEELGIKLARRDYYPDVSVGVGYIETGEALEPGVSGSGSDPLTAAASINLPVWYGRYRAAEREARFRRAAAAETREDREQRLRADLERALFHYRDAERKIDLYRDTLVPKAEESLKVTQQGFEAGKAGFPALVDAQRSLLEFQLEHQRARAERGTRLAEIEMLTGKETDGR